MGRKCEYYWCANKQGVTTGKSFHNFPKDDDLCFQWVCRCESVELVNLFSLHGAQPFVNKKMCSDHFRPEAFRIPGRSAAGLLPGQIPSRSDKMFGENLNGDNDERCEIEYLEDDADFWQWFEITQNQPTENENQSESSEFFKVEEEINGTMSSIYNLPGIQETKTNTTYYNPSELFPHDESAIYVSNTTPVSSFPQIDADYFTSQNKMNRRMIENLQGTITKLKRQLFVAKQTSERRLKALRKRNTQIADLKTKLRFLKKRKEVDEKLGMEARKNPVIFDTLRNASKAPKGRRYHQQTMKFAASTYLSGPRTYRHIRKTNHLVLPHKNTVYNRNRSIRIERGLNESIFSRIEEKTKSVKEERNKTVVLSYDGMSIKSELSYNAKSDKFYGFPDHGIRRRIKKNDTSKLATEAITVMVSGMYWKFKQPIGYYLLAHRDSAGMLVLVLI